MIRPPPLKLKYDNRFPLPAPAPKPKAKQESFFQVLYKANWRNVVMAVAGLNAIRFAFATYNAYEDALVDDYEHQSKLATVSIALCVMYAFACAIEIFGVIGVAFQRLSVVRVYVFFEFGASLLVTVAGVLKAASFFLNAEDLMYECVALALTGQSSAKSQFRSRPWPSVYPLGLRQAQKQCVAAWTHESWTQAINVFLFGFMPAMICYMMVYTYYRQTTDSTHSAYLASRQHVSTDSSRPERVAQGQGGYARIPNADVPYAGSETTQPALGNPRSAARLRAGRGTNSHSNNGGAGAITSTRTAAHTSRSLKRAHRPPALVQLEGPVFSPQRVMQSATSALSFVFSPGPPTFGVNIVGPSRMGVGAYGPAASLNLSCSGGSAKYSKFV